MEVENDIAAVGVREGDDRDYQEGERSEVKDGEVAILLEPLPW